MTDSNWFEDKPPRDLKSRIESAADREIDRRARLVKPERRTFFNFLNLDVLAGASLAVVAGLVGFRMVAEESGSDDILADSEDIDLIADMDFLEDFDILEELNDEELSS